MRKSFMVHRSASKKHRLKIVGRSFFKTVKYCGLDNMKKKKKNNEEMERIRFSIY